ncbi:hypothetical protein [Streptomyces himalayensis]|uniref:Uncharacterized protein n=1 Tax=Streptomyces himalayensis subsp. himalayensis TaxID=2756131 RepID=A0A7W0IC08_9ACTN|nr:hypothetical protein [Streptomyces himalayensis]MBA2949671.1 hypothetical protein [Streptomyces himalayensis subsp. himalayensis]
MGDTAADFLDRPPHADGGAALLPGPEAPVLWSCDNGRGFDVVRLRGDRG